MHIVPKIQTHKSGAPETVAQKKKAGEREELVNEINGLIVQHTGRKDLCIVDGKSLTVLNLIKIRDVLKIMDDKIDEDAELINASQDD